MRALPFRIGYPCPDDFNPPDHFIHKLSMVPNQEEEYTNRIETIRKEFEASEYGANVLQEIDSQIEGVETRFGNGNFDMGTLKPYKSPWLQQFRAVLWRSWHSVVKEPLISWIRIGEVIVSLFSEKKIFCSAKPGKRTRCRFQVLALIVGSIFFGQDYSQASIASINGALFWVVMNQAFSNYSSFLNVRI